MGRYFMVIVGGSISERIVHEVRTPITSIFLGTICHIKVIWSVFVNAIGLSFVSLYLLHFRGRAIRARGMMSCSDVLGLSHLSP